jgi:hypothetical protein
MQNLYSSLNKKYVIQMMIKFRWDTNMYIFWRNVYQMNKKMC